MDATDHFWQAVLNQAQSNNVSEVTGCPMPAPAPGRQGGVLHASALADPLCDICLQDRLRKLQSAHIMRSLAAKTSFSTAAGVVVSPARFGLRRGRGIAAAFVKSAVVMLTSAAAAVSCCMRRVHIGTTQKHRRGAL